MSGVKLLTVSADEGEQRLDRWFKRRFPQLTQGAVEKMCRTGQVRVDGARAKASDRIIPGQTVRVPPLPETEAPSRPRADGVSPADAKMIQELNTLGYFKYIFLTVFGKGFGDRVRK